MYDACEGRLQTNTQAAPKCVQIKLSTNRTANAAENLSADILPGVGEAGEGHQLSAPHYEPFGELEMSWRCQKGYLLGLSSSGWPADSLRADQMAASPHWPHVRCWGSCDHTTHTQSCSVE